MAFHANNDFTNRNKTWRKYIPFINMLRHLNRMYLRAKLFLHTIVLQTSSEIKPSAIGAKGLDLNSPGTTALIYKIKSDWFWAQPRDTTTPMIRLTSGTTKYFVSEEKLQSFIQLKVTSVFLVAIIFDQIKFTLRPPNNHSFKN